MCTIRDEFKLDVPKEVIAMSSGMAVGAGKSGCVCGAFNGGLLARWNVLRKNRAGRANQSKERKMYGTGSRTA